MIFGTVALLMILGLQGAAGEAAVPALPIDGKAAESFLREAKIIGLEATDTKSITKPKKATLSDGELTANALFKDIDETHEKVKLINGETLFRLEDDYKHEIAAYELDKLLGLGIVPPTVERKIGRERGSLQLWVNGSMTEWERTKVKQQSPPDMARWNDEMSTLKIFLQLIWDTDYSNISNVIVDSSWKIWKIDSSRAFYVDNQLRREDALTRFSRPMLASLENLDRTELETTMKAWLYTRQIRALWMRRCRILELADERVAEFGEDAVLYD